MTWASRTREIGGALSRAAALVDCVDLEGPLREIEADLASPVPSQAALVYGDEFRRVLIAAREFERAVAALLAVSDRLARTS